MTRTKTWRLAMMGAGLLLAQMIATPPALAHNIAGVPDFSDTFPNFRTISAAGIGTTGIPNGANGNAGIGYPIDPRDLADAGGRARVFHEHFLSGDFTTFDGSVVFAVFNGPNYTPCSPAGPILPPLPFVYTNAAGDYSVTIDFSRAAQANLGVDDFGQIVNTDWIYAYAVINDEGVDTSIRGTDAIGAVNLSFATGLRQVAADLPTGTPTFTTGATISSTGDIEPLGGAANTTNPQETTISQALATFLVFSTAGGGEGCIPDVTQRLAPPAGCNTGADACTTNIFFLTSPFGPGVANIANQGGGGSAANATNVCPGPFTYPNFRCESLVVNNVTRPGQPVQIGDQLQIVVGLNNTKPATNPPYLGVSIPGGTQRGVATVSLNVVGGAINGLTGPQTVCTEIVPDASRAAQAIFTGTFAGPGSATVTAAVSVPAPYNTGPARPFDSNEAGYVNRFTVKRTDLDCSETITVAPTIDVDKRVQFVCFRNPNNPNDIELRPAQPAKTVDAPPCGLVRFTIRVENTSGETLNTIRLSDCLPNDMIFRGNVQPATPLGMVGEGPGCVGLPNTTETVFRIPNIAPGGNYVFTFDAIVKANATAGNKVNTARVRGIGATSGLPTNTAESTATVNVKTVAATFVPVNPPGPICTGQTATFTFRFTNTGMWPLDPVVPNQCTAGTGLQIVNQNPPEGTNLGPVDPGQTRDIVVMATAVGIAGGTSRCITCGIQAFPDCYDPRDAENCRIQLNAQQCVTVSATGIDVACESPTAEADPGDVVDLSFRITNTGNVNLNPISFVCTPDPGLTVNICPAPIGPLAPGASVVVVVQVQVQAGAGGQPCVRLDATGAAPGLPRICDATDSDECCLTLERRVPTLGSYGLMLLAAMLGWVMLRRFNA